MNSQQLNDWLNAMDGVTVPGRPLIMGVLNVTPNSFSDGGQYTLLHQAVQHAQDMIKDGVDIIDVGGEASHPHGGYALISVDEELSRVLPAISAIRAFSDVSISIDTCKAAVMEAAVSAGASMINDIQALRGDGALAVAARLDVPVCLMHMRGTPDTMQDAPSYPDGVVHEISQFFSERMDACIKAGICEKRLMLDPGIGFGKTVVHNLSILNQLPAFCKHKRPLVLGASRKRMIGDVLNKPVSERLIGGIAVAVHAMMQGVHILRTHDVAETMQAFKILNAIQTNGMEIE